MYSIKFNNVYVTDYAEVVGENEKNGNLSKIKKSITDLYNGEKTFEKSQAKLQEETISDILIKNNLLDHDINMIIGGDLSNQLYSSITAVNKFNIPFLGVYSACSSFIESLIIASVFISNGDADKIICTTSSHNLAQERQFRFPVEYGVLRNENSTFTLTSALSALITNNKSNIKIIDATIGTPFECGVKDPNQIGAIMAPAAAETIISHLNHFKRKIDYYDLILTGDLGSVGVKILKEYLYEVFNIKSLNIEDAGANIYNEISEINDGASGPVVLPLYFFYNILNKKKYKKILLVGTGSMHSKTMVNQKDVIPAISHAISLEVKRWVLCMPL